ncbi:MAG: DUF3883 domain-containing protein [Chloroflexi bacterium]|nr:DUF3883 domain-containing protein [Chloroflexota bacterium]
MTAEAIPNFSVLTREVVEQLDNDQNPGQLPEDAPGWNDAFVAAIRAYKEPHRRSKDLRNLLRIAGELLYGKDIHWAMELVQNAEDAGASRMVFVFEKERVLVWNDGQPFEARDVWAICSAGHSPKRNKIGFFGIGFKSVYKMTAMPEIYSGPYALRIEDKLYPTALDPRSGPKRGAWFVLPVLRDQQAKVGSMVASLASPDFAQVLLTLTNLIEIRVIDRSGTGLSGRFRRTPVRGSPDQGWDECQVGGSWDWATPRIWRRFFHETEPVPPGVAREGRTVEPGDRSVVVLARPTDDELVDLRVHCFLPTAVESQLQWLVQGDFEPSASREQLPRSPWNEWLMREAGKALAAAVRTSARELGESPWSLVPLMKEVRDPLQSIAYQAAAAILRESAFISTRRGWRSPGGATWEFYPGVAEVVREGDLSAAAHGDVSYVRPEVLGPISATSSSRAEEVLAELGAEAIDCANVVQLFGADDDLFYRIRRDGSWWARALGLMAGHASVDDKSALAATRCVPIRGGRRVRPSPAVAADGYLVAFSRSDLTEDLLEYLGESQVYLVETFLSPRTDGRRATERSAADADLLAKVAEMLEDEPFNVAPEAGPYHVVASLVVPRLNALARSSNLSPEQVDRAWRLLEYVRQKWPSYVSEYKRRRNARATEAMIAAEVGPKLFVVASTGGPRHRGLSMRPLAESYLSTDLLGFEAMDVALADDDQVAVIDSVHARPLKVSIRRRGGRARSPSPSAVEFLRLLGAPVGPRISARPLTQVTPGDLPWVDWAGLPPGARGRVGLERDWESTDVGRLAIRWADLSERARARRGAALLRAIEADWVRLKPLASAGAAYFYNSWNPWGSAPASWAGRLMQLAWLPSVANTLERPADLVVDTTANRLALGGSALEGVLKWQPRQIDAVITLGVPAHPTTDRVIETLATLRASEGMISAADTMVIARACYQVLSDHLREAGDGDTSVPKLITTRMRGGGGRGLIYAPPPEGVGGERWWPPSRVVQNDAMKWVGPYLGQLAGRYRTAVPLWDALEIRRDLSVELACEIIRRDLDHDEDKGRALEYYGRLLSFIEEAGPRASAQSGVLALTTLEWQPPSVTWWTNRAEVLDGLATSVAWWQPGTRDPSSLRRAAEFLGIRGLGATGSGSPLAERWEVRTLEPLELEAESRWQLALRTWPHVLRQDSDPSEWETLDALVARVGSVGAAIAADLRIHLAFNQGGETARASISPPVALRARDGLLIGTSSSELFSTRAAEALATLTEANQRSAALAMSVLLSLAEHDPAELERRAARFAVATYQHREFTFKPADFEDVDPKSADRVKLRTKGKPGTKDAPPEEPFTPLADPLRYGLIGSTATNPSGHLPDPLQGGRLKPPVTEEETEGESESDKHRQPPNPRMRYANTEIEGAARPFLEEYELSNRGCTIVRQGPNVGADYVASDGRYIEVKAFSGRAPDTVELEPPEWRAAQHPEIADRYWVYVVEHLRDGQAPMITAVFNPVLDESTSKQNTGKLRVRGWKNARMQHVGQFGERSVEQVATKDQDG